MKPTDKHILQTARRYGVEPSSLKAQVFALLDLGYSRSELRFLLRQHRDPKRPSSFSSTIARYCHLWQGFQKAHPE